MKWNLFYSMTLSSIIMISAMLSLLYHLWFNNYFDLSHMLLIFGWVVLWIPLANFKKRN